MPYRDFSLISFSKLKSLQGFSYSRKW
eukprot:UN11862